MEHINLVIIGTGWFGLTIAKTYLQVHPDADLALLESADSVGGTWANHRLYPGLKSNNLLGTYENPDFPMTPERFGVQPGQHIPGQVIHDYLTQFAEEFGVTPRIRFNHRVDVVEQDKNGRWIITVTVTDNQTQKTKKISAERLVIAAGVTGNPNLPSLAGASEFAVPLFHAKDFLKHKDLLSTARKVVVYGGAKSGWDAVYAYATAGVQVEWVMRESGRGPCWMSPPHVTKKKLWLEQLVFTRILTWFNPTVWADKDGYGFWRYLLHRTFVGRWIVDQFWNALANDVLSLNGFDKHPETKKLKPWSGAFWCGTSLSILNYPTDFFQYVQDGTVKVHHADIVRLSGNTVYLSNGEALEVDALHCSTGWKHEPPINISPQSLASKLGLPCDRDPSDQRLVAKADAEILHRFPRLKHQPNVTPKKRNLKGISVHVEKSPYRLYRYVVPPSVAEDRNFVVAGVMLSLGQPVLAQVQALWITAYFDGLLELPQSRADIEYTTQLYTRFGHWRFPAGCGDKHGDFVFETLPYYDTLLRDLGIKIKRKSSWWKEITSPYSPKDYKGVVDEWIKLQNLKDRKKVV